MSMLLLLPLGLANAQTLPNDTNAQGSMMELRKRDYTMELNLRARQLFVPDSILDTWFYNSDTTGAYPEPRPSIGAQVFGLEYAFTQENTSWVIWGEYMASGLEEGYWDDVDTGDTVDHDDGDWVRPDNFSGWWTGFNYNYILPLTPPEKATHLDFVAGGGAGFGYITGDLTYWRPGTAIETDCEPAAPAYVRRKVCPADGGKEFPRFLPMLDVTLGLQLNFADRAHIRLEGGIHDMLFYGVSGGGRF